MAPAGQRNSSATARCRGSSAGRCAAKAVAGGVVSAPAVAAAPAPVPAEAADAADAAGGEPRSVLRPPFDRFERVRELGRGACGVVWLVRRRSDRQLLAMKTIMLPPLASRDEKAMLERRQALREVEILKGMQSPHVLRHEETVLTPPTTANGRSELHIFTEYCDAGDLASHLRKASSGPGLTESDVWGISASILAGLRDLHARRILHRDLKPANIFLRYEKSGGQQPGGLRRKLSLGAGRTRATGFDASRIRVLLGDLGIARTISNTQPMAETMVGTPLYCAPEIFEGEPYDEKADIYSYGICVYELMHGQPPWAHVQHVAGLARHVLQLDGDPSEHEVKLDARYSQDLRQLVRDCMARFAVDRPSAADLVSRIPEAHRRAAGLGRPPTTSSPSPPLPARSRDATVVEGAAVAEALTAEAAAAPVGTAVEEAAQAVAGEAPAILQERCSEASASAGDGSGSASSQECTALPASAVSPLPPVAARPPPIPIRQPSGPGAANRCESPFAFKPPSRSSSFDNDRIPTERSGHVQTEDDAAPPPKCGGASARGLVSMFEEALALVPAAATLLSLDITLKPYMAPQACEAADEEAAENELTVRGVTFSTKAVAPAAGGPMLDTVALETLPTSQFASRPVSATGSRPPSARGQRPSPVAARAGARGYVAKAQAYLARWQRDRKEERRNPSSSPLATPSPQNGARKRPVGGEQASGQLLEIRGIAPARTPKVPHRAAVAV